MAPIKEIFLEEDDEQELRVTFYPELYLQRRIWILDILRRENITKILDVGCGEGELLSPLCQPAPWLGIPPTDRLPPEAPSSPLISPTFNSVNDIPNLHPSLIHGLDISPNDLAFAIDRTRPPEPEPPFDPENPPPRTYALSLTRFEPLDVKLWEGGLEIINEEFVGIECIVSTEVIEHLSPSTYPFFVPVLLGVYHPKFLLITTPSYTFNARFTSPNAPSSVRRGYADPTQRTDRIFRHSDHKFEWTGDEFEAWVEETAKEWGYEAKWSSIGRALNKDPYGRDEQLGGASFVVEFQKLAGGALLTDGERERRGREVVDNLLLLQGNATGMDTGRPPHKLAAHHFHPAHPSSENPISLPDIASIVKDKMDFNRESLMHVDELWFEKEVAVACGGWIEFLVRAVEASPELVLKKEENGINRKRDLWTVEIVGRTGVQRNLWLKTDLKADSDRRSSIDYIPEDWTPGQGPLSLDDSTDDFGESTGAEGDVSLNNSEDEDDAQAWSHWPKHNNTAWGESSGLATEKCGDQMWGESSDDEKKERKPPPTASSAGPKKLRHVASSSAGWDGDEDESDEITS